MEVSKSTKETICYEEYATRGKRSRLGRARGFAFFPAPWGYGYHYAMDIVGKESLVVLFLNKNCLKDLNNCNLFFPVRPINSPRWEWDPRSNLFEYNQFKNRKLKIRVASRNANGTEIPCELAKFVERCIEACKSDQDCKKYLNT